MAETLLLTLVGVAFLAAGARILANEGDPAIRAWTIGWLAFISSALLAGMVEEAPGASMHLPLFFAYVTSSAAPLCFLVGVFALVRWEPPSWVVPMSAVIITTRAFTGVLGNVAMAEVLSLPVEAGSHLGAAYLVWRWSRHSGHPHDRTALASSHVMMGIAEAFIAISSLQGWDAQGTKLPVSIATVALAATQIVVVLRLSSDRVDEVVEDRERDLALLRDLAHLGTRHAAGPPLLQDAGQLLSGRLPVDWVGFWRWSRSGGRWVASEASGVPREVCATVQMLALRVDDLTSQPGGSEPPSLTELSEDCEGLDDASCALIPLEWQGDVLGVMGMGRLDGRPLAANVRSVLGTLAGELSLSLSHVLSIQQRDRANLALLRERRKLAAVIETAPIGMLVTTSDGFVELMNSSAAEHVGCEEPERFIGGPMSVFLDDFFQRVTDPQRLVENVQTETSDDGVMRDFEVEVLRPEPATLLLFSSAVHDDRGRVTARIWASRDVTPERALGDQLRHAQKLETIGTLSGGIAHDFNNQLAVVLGNVRFARDSIGDAAISPIDVDEALADVERAADHCAQLTRSLLSFARRAPVSLGQIEPNEIVRDLSELLRPLLPASIELECEAEPDLPPILADGAQLQQVLVNLALNARDAIDDHGSIRIEAGVREVEVDHVRRRGVGRPGRYLYFGVSDSGHGLDADTIDRIFEPFYTTKPVGEGTGLGLAIVHGVVTAHAGWIDVESERGRGSDFHIYLPIDDDTAMTDDQGADAESTNDTIALSTAGEHRERVLVADDDEAVRNVLVRGLEAHGFEVVTAEDGDEAVKRFAEDPDGIDAVVLDWSMPGLQGPEAAEEILRIAPDVPVLVATGHGAMDTEAELEIIAKPFDIAWLASRIRARIGGGG